MLSLKKQLRGSHRVAQKKNKTCILETGDLWQVGLCLFALATLTQLFNLFLSLGVLIYRENEKKRPGEEAELAECNPSPQETLDLSSNTT